MKQSPPPLYMLDSPTRPFAILWKLLNELKLPYLRMVWTGPNDHSKMLYMPAVITTHSTRIAVDFENWHSTTTKERERYAVQTYGMTLVKLKTRWSKLEMEYAIRKTIQEVESTHPTLEWVNPITPENWNTPGIHLQHIPEPEWPGLEHKFIDLD